MPSGVPRYSEEYLAQDRGHVLVATCVFLIIFETIIVALRAYARHLNKSSFFLEDVLIFTAWILNIGLNATAINSVYHAGVGRHLAYVLITDRSKLRAWAKSILAVEYLYFTAATLPKIGVVTLYLRIFTNRAARWTCHALLVFIIVNWIAYIIVTSLQCRPLAFLWDKSIPGGHCFNVQAFYESSSVPNLFSDLVIAVLPIPTIVNLHASWPRKVGLAVIFATGSVGIIGSCIRMTTFFTTDAFRDATWVSVPLMAWTAVEPGMYLIAACLLAFRPLLSKLPARFRPSESKSHPRQTPSKLRSPNTSTDRRAQSQNHQQHSQNGKPTFIQMGPTHYHYHQQQQHRQRETDEYGSYHSIPSSKLNDSHEYLHDNDMESGRVYAPRHTRV